MMTTYCVWLTHNDIQTLPWAVDKAERAMRSALPTDEVNHVFVDGGVKTFLKRWSTDGTVGYAMDAGTLLPYPGGEPEKKTQGLRYVDTQADKGDWVLFLYGNEEIDELFFPSARVGILTMKVDDDLVNRARLIRWERGLSYHGHDLYNFEKELVATRTHAEDDASCGQGRRVSCS